MSWLAFFAVFAVLRCWALVGIWRSAGRHVARGGSPTWANIARFLLIAGLLASLAQAKNYGLQVIEYGQLAMGHDPLGPGPSLEISKDRDEVVLDGTITAGTAELFEQLLNKAPQVRSVTLNSRGGRILEALRIASTVSSRGLSTRVDKTCESACTLVLLAGRERFAHRLAQIGFHQPDFPGLTEEQRQFSVESNSRDYISAGMSSEFVSRMMETPPSDMWYPGHDELVQAGVLTDEEIVVGTDPAMDLVSRAISDTASSISQNSPQKLDEATRLLGAVANGHELVIRHELSFPVEASRVERVRADLKKHILKGFCKDESARAIVDAGGKFTYRYFPSDGPQFDVIITECT